MVRYNLIYFLFISFLSSSLLGMSADEQWKLVLDNRDRAGLSNLIEADIQPSPKLLAEHLTTKNKGSYMSFNGHVYNVIEYFSYKLGWESYGQKVQECAFGQDEPSVSWRIYDPKDTVDHLLMQDEFGKTNYSFINLQKNLTEYSLSKTKSRDLTKQPKSPEQGDGTPQESQKAKISQPVKHADSPPTPKTEISINTSIVLINQYGFSEKNKKIIALAAAGILAYGFYILCKLKKVELMIDDPNRWMNWKNNLSIQELAASSPKELITQLLDAVFDKYKDPKYLSDNAIAFKQCLKDMKYEIASLQWYLQESATLTNMHLAGVAGIHDIYINKCKNRLEKLTILYRFFLKWFIKRQMSKSSFAA